MPDHKKRASQPEKPSETPDGPPPAPPPGHGEVSDTDLLTVARRLARGRLEQIYRLSPAVRARAADVLRRASRLESSVELSGDPEVAYVVEPVVDGDGWVAWVYGSPKTFKTAPVPEAALQRLCKMKRAGEALMQSDPPERGDAPEHPDDQEVPDA